jgi:excisionase family DNA binding protein
MHDGQPMTSTLRLRGPALYNIEDTCRALGGIGRTTVFELIRSGELESVKVRERRLVPAHAIADFVERLCGE